MSIGNEDPQAEQATLDDDDGFVLDDDEDDDEGHAGFEHRVAAACQRHDENRVTPY